MDMALQYRGWNDLSWAYKQHDGPWLIVTKSSDGSTTTTIQKWQVDDFLKNVPKENVIRAAPLSSSGDPVLYPVVSNPEVWNAAVLSCVDRILAEVTDAGSEEDYSDYTYNRGLERAAKVTHNLIVENVNRDH